VFQDRQLRMLSPRVGPLSWAGGVFIAYDFHGAPRASGRCGHQVLPFNFFGRPGRREIQAISAILLPKRQRTLNEMAMGSKRFLGTCPQQIEIPKTLPPSQLPWIAG
jgi:hypothetical protein